jgi:hypothetical protein
MSSQHLVKSKRKGKLPKTKILIGAGDHSPDSSTHASPLHSPTKNSNSRNKPIQSLNDLVSGEADSKEVLKLAEVFMADKAAMGAKAEAEARVKKNADEDRPIRPLLMPPKERQARVRDLAFKMYSDGDGATEAVMSLTDMIDLEEWTHVGMEMGVQVVAELMKLIVESVIKRESEWLVKNPLGVKVFPLPDENVKMLGLISWKAIVKAKGVVGQYLRLPIQPGLGFTKEGYVKLLDGAGRRNLNHLTELQDKLPMMQLLLTLARFRHVCMQLAKIPRLTETLYEWTSLKGQKTVSDMAFKLLQRLHTADKLLRGAGDGGHTENLRRSLSTCSSLGAPELHALRTNKSKFPPQALDSAIVLTDDTASQDRSGRKSSAPDRLRIPDHLKPAPLTYGIGTQSILNPAPKSFLSLRYQAATMTLAPPPRPYSSLIDSFPRDSPVCTFDRVRI